MTKRLFLTLLLLPATLHAAPTVDELIAKATEAMGGKEKLAAVKSMSMQGTVSLKAQGLEGTFEMLAKNDNAVLVVQLPGVGKVQSGITDGVGYELSDLMGARLLSEQEKEQVFAGMQAGSEFDSIKKLKDATVTGPEKVGEHEAYKISGTNPYGSEESYYIDSKSHRLIQTQLVIESQMGKMPTTVRLEDFQKTEEIEMPRRIVTQVGPMEMVTTITELKINPGIEDGKFSLPPEAKALAERQTAASPATQPAVPQ